MKNRCSASGMPGPDTPQETSQNMDSISESLRKKKLILLVDDEPDLREVISLRLRTAGFDVVVASNGRQAVNMARNFKPDLIVMDLYMPEMDGHQAIEAIRKEIPEHFPVIILTASNEMEDVMNACVNEADAYLTKPFNPAELIKTADQLLAKKFQGKK
ncbi:MAG: response regulator [Bdellovibrionales bacterium]|nr:response regulator [Bdellovibrionales bacterium]